GGEIKASGTKENAAPWSIGIQDPANPNNAIATITLDGALGLATSGSYRNFFVEDGQRYSHLINPKSGFSIEHDTTSVTVVHPSTTVADALATALMVMPLDKGMRWAEQNNIAVMFVYGAGQPSIRYTTTMAQYMKEKSG
ncbi:MAG: FAD:protein FMN transferase, partial [Pseudomonadota bacterium]